MYTQNDWRLYQENAIYHHGIKGMKWGVMNGPPYPLGSAISTGKRLIGKAAGAIKRHHEKRVQAAEIKKQVKQEKKVLKEAEEEAKKQQSDYEAKQKVIMSNDADKILKIADTLSTEQLKDAQQRLLYVNKMKEYQAPSKMDKALKNLKKAKEWTETGVDAWNTFAKVYNAVRPDDPLPTVGEGIKNATKGAKQQQQDGENQSNQQSGKPGKKPNSQFTMDDVAPPEPPKPASTSTASESESESKSKSKPSSSSEPSYSEKLSSWAAEKEASRPMSDSERSEYNKSVTRQTISAMAREKDIKERADAFDNLTATWARNEQYLRSSSGSEPSYSQNVTRMNISAMAREKDIKERADAFDNLTAAWDRNDEYLHHGMIYFEIFHDVFDLDTILIG